MNEIKISKLNQNTYVLDGINKFSGRQLMKFNIFLNVLTDVSLKKNDESVLLAYKLDDKNAIAKSIEGIIKHIEKQNLSVSLDSDVTQLIIEQMEFQEECSSTLNQLKSIQNGTILDSIQFKEYCEFCDNTLQIKLREYQYKAAFLLSVGKGGFDFSVPGAGKTIITYAAYSYLKTMGIVDHIFVIGPVSAYNAWFDEYKTCFGNQPEFENLAEDNTKDCKIYLNSSEWNHKEISFINMEKVRLLISEIVRCILTSKTLVIIDEAHKIKNPDAAVTKAVLEITKYACARIILTGTPMPNGYEDLYSLTKTFSPFNDILPFNYNQLRIMTKKDASTKQTEVIRNSIGPYYSRISKKYLLETKELLPPNFHIMLCEMNEDQEILYAKLNKFCGKISENIDEDILEGLKKAISIRKMQVSANPALLQKSIISSMDELKEEYAELSNKENIDIGMLIKADRNIMEEFSDSSIVKIVNRYVNKSVTTTKNSKAIEIAKELVESGEKVLIWDVFVKNMEILKHQLEVTIDVRVELINGSVTGVDRQIAIKNFREGDSMILVANPATLAESISLHKVCQNAIYVNRNFNAAQFIQSKDRIHRINMPVGTTANYYFLLNNESIDLCVDSRLKQKEDRMLAILDADDIEIGGAEMEDASIMSKQDIDDSFRR